MFTVFTTLRKALVVSVQKTKKFEHENKSLASERRNFEQQKWGLQQQIEQLEGEQMTIKNRLRKDKEQLESELDNKKLMLMRNQASVAELTAQKESMKGQVDEYEAKIKKLISELETESKMHIQKVNELHEHYMGYKSESAELQARVSLYKSE